MALADFAADFRLVAGGKNPSPRTAAIIVSAGNSTRMGGTVSKQFLTLCGKPVLAHTLLAFEQTKQIDEIVVVAKSDAIEAVWQLAEQYGIKKLTHVTSGGKTRAASVQRGFSIKPQRVDIFTVSVTAVAAVAARWRYAMRQTLAT